MVFGKGLAKFAGTLKKGAHLQVEGELRSRKYDSTKTGAEETIWEIRVDSILKLDRAEKASPEKQEAGDETHEEAARKPLLNASEQLELRRSQRRRIDVAGDEPD